LLQGFVSGHWIQSLGPHPPEGQSYIPRVRDLCGPDYKHAPPPGSLTRRKFIRFSMGCAGWLPPVICR